MSYLADSRVHLDKAREFLESARDECDCDFERYNAAVSAAVISEPVAEVMPEQWLIRSCSGM